MPVRAEPTPNPNAMKFIVGAAVGDSRTYVKGSTPDEDFVSQLLVLEGVASVFLTADFVTISKTPAASWDSIAQQTTAILENHFGD